MHHSQNLICAVLIVASACSTAVRSGTINPPRWIINFFLLAKRKRLSTIVLRWRLNLRNCRFLQSESFTLPFKTFNAHSLILYSSSLSLFAIIALRKLGRASFTACSLWKLDFMRLSINRGIHSGDTFVQKDIGSKRQSIVCVLGEIKNKVAVRTGCSVSIRIL